MISYHTIRNEVKSMEQVKNKEQLVVDELAAQLAPILRRHGVIRAAVFGSVARGEATRTSDLDLSVEFESGRKITLFSILNLQYEIEDILGKKVHLSLPENVKPFLRDIIKRDLVYIL